MNSDDEISNKDVDGLCSLRGSVLASTASFQHSPFISHSQQSTGSFRSINTMRRLAARSGGLGIAALSYVAIDYLRHISPTWHSRLQPALWFFLAVIAMSRIPFYKHWSAEFRAAIPFVASMVFMLAAFLVEVISMVAVGDGRVPGGARRRGGVTSWRCSVTKKKTQCGQAGGAREDVLMGYIGNSMEPY